MKFPSLKTLAHFIIVPIVGIVAVALRYEPPKFDDPYIIHHTPAHAFQAPIPLPNGYLWHPADTNQIIYQAYGSDYQVTHDNLAGVPEQWTVAESGENVNLVWVNDRTELWHAQLDNEGNFALPPVRLAEPTILQVAVHPLTDGGAMVLWQAEAQFTRPLFYALLDNQGRPRFQGQILPDVEHFALGGATDERILLTWTVANIPTVNYSAVPLENLRQSPPLPLNNPTAINLDLADGAWVNEVGIAGDAWVVWGVNQLDDLDQTLFFAVNISDSATIIPLTWGERRLRWLGNVRPATTEPYITLTAYEDGQWKPILAKIEPNQSLYIEYTPDVRSDASAPQFLRKGAVGSVGLSEHGELTQTIRMFIIPQPIIMPLLWERPWIVLLWLIAPVIILGLYGNTLNGSRGAVVAYWLGKVLYSLAWGNRTLNDIVIMLSIATGLGLLSVLLLRSNLRRQTLAYILIDMVASFILWTVFF